MQTHTAERMFMTAWCCFVLLMLISVNKATHKYMLHITHRDVLEESSCVFFHCHDNLIIWKFGRSRESVKAHAPNTTRLDPTENPRLRSLSHTHSYSCAQWECAGDHWSVKWFCYHVVCVEYVFPSSFHGRCAWWVCGAGVFWGVHLVSVSICYWARRVEAVHVQTSISSWSSAFVIWHRETPTPKYSKCFFWAQCMWSLWILLDL